MTFSGTLAGSPNLAISFPIAPLQTVFLPANLLGPGATLTADSQFPLYLPPFASGASIPVAGTSTGLTIDLVIEQ